MSGKTDGKPTAAESSLHLKRIQFGTVTGFDRKVVKQPTRCKVARLKCWPPLFLLHLSMSFCCRHRFARHFFRLFAGCSGLCPSDRSRFTPPLAFLLFFNIIFWGCIFFFFTAIRVHPAGEISYSDHVNSFSASMYLYFIFLTYSNYLSPIRKFYRNCSQLNRVGPS